MIGNQNIVPTLSEDAEGAEGAEDAEGAEGAEDAKDAEDLDASNIAVASFKIFGRLTNQLHICNWLVIALNWGGISSSLPSPS